MKNSRTVNQFKGRAIGSFFFAGLGSLWIVLSLYAKQILSIVTAGGVLLVTVLLLLAVLRLLQQAERWPRVPDDPSIGRAFARINIVQWVAVFLVAFSFAKLHIDAYVLSAIAAIVGLHLLPLARLFRYPLHYVTGGLLMAWASATALLAPVNQMQGITAMGTGLILWLSAAVTLFIALQASRATREPLAC